MNCVLSVFLSPYTEQIRDKPSHPIRLNTQKLYSQYFKTVSERKRDNPLQNKRVCFISQRVPRSKHCTPRLYRTSLLVSYEVKVAVCSGVLTKHKRTVSTTQNF